MPGVPDDVHRAAWRQYRAERPANFTLMRRRCSICSTGLPRYHELSSLKGRGVVKDVLGCFDLRVDSAEPTAVSRWSARSAARTNDLDDGAERFSACSVGVDAGEHQLAMWLWCNVSRVDA